MPYKDPAKMAEYMRHRRSSKTGKVNVNPLTQNVNPVNPPKKFSQVSGSYEGGNWMGICPVCNHHNRMDPKRSYRPVERCDHFQQLLKPGTASEFIFSRELTPKTINPVNPNPKSVNPVNPNKTRKDKENRVNVNPLTQSVNPVSLEKYLLSYSRNKYPFVLYSLQFLT